MNGVPGMKYYSKYETLLKMLKKFLINVKKKIPKCYVKIICGLFQKIHCCKKGVLPT